MKRTQGEIKMSERKMRCDLILNLLLYFLFKYICFLFLRYKIAINCVLHCFNILPSQAQNLQNKETKKQRWMPCVYSNVFFHFIAILFLLSIFFLFILAFNLKCLVRPMNKYQDDWVNKK